MICTSQKSAIVKLASFQILVPANHKCWVLSNQLEPVWFGKLAETLGKNGLSWVSSFLLEPSQNFFFFPTEYELSLLWVEQCFLCPSLKQLFIFSFESWGFEHILYRPLSYMLLEGRKRVRFCHSCSILYVSDASCMTGSETHYNTGQSGYTQHSYLPWP